MHEQARHDYVKINNIELNIHCFIYTKMGAKLSTNFLVVLLINVWKSLTIKVASIIISNSI